MRRPISAILLCALLVLLQACCCLDGKPPKCPACEHHNRHACHGHPEPAFDFSQGKPPGGGLVFGTADFDTTSGAVLIKIQVEELAGIPGTEANITAWAGAGSVVSTPTAPPTTGTVVYSSSGDVNLPHWTTHLDRTFDSSNPHYWIIVKVDHDTGTGRDVRWAYYTWTVAATPSPDTPRNFD